MADRVRTCWKCGYDLDGLPFDQSCPECAAEPDARPDEPLGRVLTPLAVAAVLGGAALTFATLFLPGLILLIVAHGLGRRLRHPAGEFRVTHRRARIAVVAEHSIWVWGLWFVMMLLVDVFHPGIWNWW